MLKMFKIEGFMISFGIVLVILSWKGFSTAVNGEPILSNRRFAIATVENVVGFSLMLIASSLLC